MAGVDNPLNIKTFEYARYVIFNDHCYTPLTSPSQKHSRKSESPEPSSSPTLELHSPVINATKTVKGRVIKSTVNRDLFQAGELNKSTEKDDSDAGSQNEDSETDEDSYSSGNVSSENDRDSDLDFNIYDRPSARSKKPSKRGRRRKAGHIDRKKRQSTSSNIDREIESLFGDDVGENSKKGRKILQKKQRSSGGFGSEEKKNIKNTYLKKSISIKDKYKPGVNLSSPPSSSSGIISLSDTLKSRSEDVIKKPLIITEKSEQSIYHSGHHSSTDQYVKSQLHQTPTKIHAQDQHSHTSTIIGSTEKQMPPLAQIKPPPVVHKKRPPALHVEALFSDMTSLFSTPDIIKKVSTEHVKSNVSTPTPSSTHLSSPLHSLTPTNMRPLNVASNNPHATQTSHSHPTQTVTSGFMALNPPSNKNSRNTLLPSQISIQTHNSNIELASEQDKQLDLIDSIVKQELEQSASMMSTQMNEDIPNIVKMLENNPVDTMSDTSAILGNVLNQQTSQFQNVNTTIPLQNIDYNLDSLTNTDDGLTEDLMKHVAVLAENKNLQEIIDKQVLGVQNTATLNLNAINPIATTSSPLIGNLVNIRGNINTNELNTTPNVKLSISQIANPIKSATKDLNVERKIIRPDGRVITLPPMEAPTTRAKRRAQAQPNDDRQKPTPATITQSPASIKDETQISAKVSKRASAYSSRNVSVDSKESKTSRRSSVSVSSAASAAAVTQPSQPTADTDDAMDSDESWNSEDDPDRLWCICQQPHNNRFMICCDSCEEWFHGKCVNITKAMGQQMEEKGVEWTCPKCIKKKTPEVSSYIFDIFNIFQYSLFNMSYNLSINF